MEISFLCGTKPPPWKSILFCNLTIMTVHLYAYCTEIRQVFILYRDGLVLQYTVCGSTCSNSGPPQIVYKLNWTLSSGWG